MQGGVNRVAQHYRVLAVLSIIYSGLHVLAGLGVVFFARFFLPHVLDMAQPRPPQFVTSLVEIVGWFLVGISAIGLVAGFGLLSHAPWARTLMLIAGFIALFNVPIGTALGIYAIWVLMSSGAEQEYRRLIMEPTASYATAHRV
jgi:hypothetical protein